MNSKIKNVLIWVGTIGAVISAVAYLSAIVVLILGFEKALEMNQMLVIAILGAITGISITSMLRAQGVAFAKQEPGVKEIMNEYYKAINKNKRLDKLHTIKWHMVWSTIRDIFMKSTTVAASTFFAMYIFIDGSGDFGLIGLAIANLSMFTCFGLLALSKSYDYYLEEHLEAIKEFTKRIQANSPRLKENERPFVDEKEDKNGDIFDITTTSTKE